MQYVVPNYLRNGWMAYETAKIQERQQAQHLSLISHLDPYWNYSGCIVYTNERRKAPNIRKCLVLLDVHHI